MVYRFEWFFFSTGVRCCQCRKFFHSSTKEENTLLSVLYYQHLIPPLKRMFQFPQMNCQPILHKQIFISKRKLFIRTNKEEIHYLKFCRYELFVERKMVKWLSLLQQVDPSQFEFHCILVYWESRVCRQEGTDTLLLKCEITTFLKRKKNNTSCLLTKHTISIVVDKKIFIESCWNFERTFSFERRQHSCLFVEFHFEKIVFNLQITWTEKRKQKRIVNIK